MEKLVVDQIGSELQARLKVLIFTAAHGWQRSLRVTADERDVLVAALVSLATSEGKK